MNLATLVKYFGLPFSILSVFVQTVPVYACDPCALARVAQLEGHEESSLTLGLSEQLSAYKKTENARQQNVSTADYTKAYSTTQLTLGYDPNDTMGIQLTVPFIYRYFDERRRFQEQSEHDSGLGDIVISGSYSPINVRKVNTTFVLTTLFGVKLPTGDTGELNDARVAGDSGESDDRRVEHHVAIQGGSGSGGNGRVLSIGTGSVDYLLASSILLRQERNFWYGFIQYSIRTEGDYDYRFANDTVWSFGPARYLVLTDDLSLALRLNFSGEHKGLDRQDGKDISGSAVDTVFIGPELFLALPPKWSSNLGVDLPIEKRQSDTLLEPTWRMRVSLQRRF